jgi:hypothetical protein
MNDQSGLAAAEASRALEFVPLPRRDAIGLTLALAGFCVASCGAILWHLPGTAGYVGLGLLCGGFTMFSLTIWLLQPHKAAKHAAHRFRHHARKVGRQHTPTSAPEMTDAEFDALEDALDENFGRRDRY